MTEKLTLNQQNVKHQTSFKARQRALDEDAYKEKKRLEMAVYRAKRKKQEELLNPKPITQAPKKIIALPEVAEPKKLNRGKKSKKKLIDNPEIIPLFQRTNKQLEQSSIDDYTSKINIINKLMTGKALQQEIKREIIKLIEGKDFKQAVIDNNIKYFQDINVVVQKLRDKYQNDRTFRNYINVLVVILSRIPK